jgi:YaaC-like Protein
LLVTWSGIDEATGERRRGLDDIAPEYRYQDERWIRPKLGSKDSVPPSALMTWWALLYGLSILARYEPDEWVPALDVDSSEIAVHIASALDEALAVIPALVLDALVGFPLPLVFRPVLP